MDSLQLYRYISTFCLGSQSPFPCRVLPSFLLVILNAKMIKRFHEVIEKRGIMRAKTFLAGSSRLSLAQTTGVSSSEEEDHVSYQVRLEIKD